ncbi:unnamed protein product, partial [Prorocentrum cordatum]
MELGGSDEDTWDVAFSDEHIRAICANVVAEQLKDLKKEVDSAVATSISESELPRKLDKYIQVTLNPRLDELRREFTTKSDTLSAIVQSVDTKVEAHTKDIQELEDTVKQLQAELAVANQRPSKPVVFSFAFEREVDYSIIKINAGKLVSKAKVQEALQPWLEVDAGFAADWWSIECRDVLSRVFTVRVAGGEGLTARRVAKALSMLRVDGHWRQFEIEAHSGEGATKLHVSADKNPRTIKPEIMGRKVKGLLTTFLGNSHRLFLDRERGWLSAKWNVATINRLGLDKDRLAE